MAMLRERKKEIMAYCDQHPEFKRVTVLEIIFYYCNKPTPSLVTLLVHNGSVLFKTCSKADTYNPSKTKYWCEERVSASMEQKASLETKDKTTIKADVPIEKDGGIVLGTGMGFNLGDVGAGDASAGPSGVGPLHASHSPTCIP